MAKGFRQRFQRAILPRREGAEPRICGTIGVPYNRYLTGAFLDCLDELETPPNVWIMRREGTYVQQQREYIASHFKGDWLFFIDSDHFLPRQTLTRLLSHNLPIVAGLYFKRGDTFEPQLYEYAGWDEGLKEHRYRPMSQRVVDYLQAHRAELDNLVTVLPKPNLVECDAVGGGCLLIRREALEKIEAPYFTEVIAEDLAFCRKAKEHGYKIHCDTSILLGHTYEAITGWMHFLAKRGVVG